jgi:SAM-dependent methyltransferase
VFDAGYFEQAAGGGYAGYTRDEELHRHNARARLRRLARAGARSPGRLLDVGCAAGFFLDESRRAGWDVVGVDVSAWARDKARGDLGLDVRPSLDEVARRESGTFDVVTFFQVLEHLADPQTALRLGHACLKPGGLLMIEAWDSRSWTARLCGRHWQVLTPPSVIHLFSRRSLELLLETEQFEIETIRCTSKYVSAGFVGALLASEHPKTLRFLGWLTSRRGIRGIGCPYMLDDLITVTARRR